MKRIHFYLLITSGLPNFFRISGFINPRVCVWACECVCVLSNLNLLFIAGIFPIALISSDFHLITQSKSYSDAKTHCRDFYGDLATVHNRSDMNNLISLASNVTIRAWIGLENGRVWMWHWSQPHQKLGYFNWRAEEPQNNSQDGCAALDERGEWFDSDCTDRRSFICRGEWPHAQIWVHLNAEIETSLCVLMPNLRHRRDGCAHICCWGQIMERRSESLQEPCVWSGQHTLSRRESGRADSLGLAKRVDRPFQGPLEVVWRQPFLIPRLETVPAQLPSRPGLCGRRVQRPGEVERPGL